MANSQVLDGLLGLSVGDALGVPVEFQSRERLRGHPVTDMVGYGTHNLPPGTWSDDSSLAFCLAESLCQGFDLQDMADRFGRWLFEGYWTPHGKVFDVGMATREAIFKFRSGKVDPVEAGGKGESSNGNGSLMRILPLAYYLRGREDLFAITHQVSCLTHAHPRSQLGCAIYIQFVIYLLDGLSPEESYNATQNVVLQYYTGKSPHQEQLEYYTRILQQDISQLPEEKINSSGYVVHTLEAALWCLLNSDSYSKTVLKAVNLGKDTDTTATVAGGLAGIHYGVANIPQTWVEKLARKEDIADLAYRLETAITG